MLLNSKFDILRGHPNGGAIDETFPIHSAGGVFDSIVRARDDVVDSRVDDDHIRLESETFEPESFQVARDIQAVEAQVHDLDVRRRACCLHLLPEEAIDGLAIRDSKPVGRGAAEKDYADGLGRFR